LDDFDLSIYNHNRIFRLPNSRHKETGLYKYLLTYDEFSTLEIDEIAALATTPSPNKPEISRANLLPSEPLIAIYWNSRKLDLDITDDREVRVSVRSQDNDEPGFFGPVGVGDRNNGLFKQACVLFDRSELYESSVRDIIGAINQASPEPLPESEIRTLVRSAAQRTVPGPVSANQEDDTGLLDFGQALDNMIEYESAEYKPLTCLFPQLDETMRNRYGGKVACFIGSKGTMKSYAVQNIVSQNVKNGCLAACSSMEMSIHETTLRFAELFGNAAIESKSRISDLIRDYARKDREGAVAYCRQQYREYFNKLILEPKSFMTVDAYDKWLTQITNQCGKPDLLVIDGLSMMGGEKQELERFSTNTAELKDLAKKWDVFIPVICHTNKGADQFTRVSDKFTRSGEKALDNCDWWACFAKLIVGGTKRDYQVAQGKGHAHIYDKRGTGRTYDIVFDIHPQTSVITPSEESPEGNYVRYEDLPESDEPKKIARKPIF
jgi:hypothetical protein